MIFRRRRPRIEKLGATGDRDGLIAALRHQDVVTDRRGRVHDIGVSVRAGAAEALGKLEPSAEATRALVDALRDRDERVRLAAVRSLGVVGDARVAETLALVVASRDGDETLRSAALDALIELSEPAGAYAYAKALVSSARADALGASERVAFERLLTTCDRADVAVRVVDEVLEQARAARAVSPVGLHVFTWIGSAAVDPLLVRLRDPGVAAAAAMGLGALRDARAVEPLITLLDSTDARARHAATWSLGQLRDPRAVEPLLRVTSDENTGVREEAADALNKLGSVGVIVGVAALVQRILPALKQLEPAAVPALRQAPPPQLAARPPHTSQRLLRWAFASR